MSKPPTPVSDEVSAALLGSDPKLVAKVKQMEVALAAGVSEVVINNKFPHWPKPQMTVLITVIVGIITIMGKVIDVGWKVGSIDQRLISIEARHADFMDRDEMLLRLELLRDQMQPPTQIIDETRTPQRRQGYVDDGLPKFDDGLRGSGTKRESR